MSKFKLIPYSVKILELDGREKLKINNLNGQGLDFFDLFESFLDSYSKDQVMDEFSQTISCKEKSIDERIINGEFNVGTFGISSDFYDVQSKKLRKNAKKYFDSELFPYSFLIDFPIESYSSTLILLSKGNIGIKTLLERCLNDFLQSHNYRVIFKRLISKEIISKIRTSKMNEIRLIKRTYHIDDTELFDDGTDEDIIKIELYKPKKNRRVRLSQYIIDVLSNSETKYYEIDDEKYDEIQVIIQEDGNNHTLTFDGSNSHINEAYIIPDDAIGENGKLSPQYILTLEKKYLSYINQNIGR